MRETTPSSLPHASPDRPPIRLLLLGIRFAFLLPLWILYVTAFWGHFTGFWPAFVRTYAGFASRYFWWLYTNLYRDHFPVTGNLITHYYPVWLGVTVLFAGLLPILAMRLAGRRAGDIALAGPNRWGWRVIFIAVVISLPFAFFIAREQPTLAEAARTRFSRPLARRCIMLASTIPEHILLTGICVASFLPGLRFPKPPPLAPVEGTGSQRVLRWLGLAQPTRRQDSRLGRLWAWLGVDAAAVLAIVGGGILFGIVHIGDRPVELITSFPGGMAVCYVSYRSRSVWPGWVAHVSMMAFIQIMMVLMGRV